MSQSFKIIKSYKIFIISKLHFSSEKALQRAQSLKMTFLLYSFTIFLLFSGCADSNQNTSRENSGNQYAKGFSIEKQENITKLTVFNPWEKAKNVSMEYYLLDKNQAIPDSLSGKMVFQTPIKKVICLSTTHIGFLDALDETAIVTGISGSRYVTSDAVRERIDNGEAPDVGYGSNLNFELIVQQKPDLVMAYGIGGEVTSMILKLEELGIPVVMVAEFLEETPLGKAEWIKFIAPFFNKEKLADEYFSAVKEEYNRLRDMALHQAEKPKVLVGSPYKDSWWVPGGKSYLAHLIEDAGGNYPGKTNTSHESFVISFEHAMVWGAEADVWINMASLASKQEILGTDTRFGNFRVFREGEIFNNIKRMIPGGGNDFWESGTVNPHLVLRDLISIFHPELISEEPVYYLEIE